MKDGRKRITQATNKNKTLQRHHVQCSIKHVLLKRLKHFVVNKKIILIYPVYKSGKIERKRKPLHLGKSFMKKKDCQCGFELWKD